MKREDFHVGQTVYLFRIRDYYSESTIEKRIVETNVIAVGRKYLTVDYWGRMSFDMTNDFCEKSIYSPSYELYLSKEDIYQAVKTKRLRVIVRNKLEDTLSKIPLEGLQDILEVLEKYNSTQ